MPNLSPTVVPRLKDTPRNARSANIAACMALGHFMESMLGPRGRDSAIMEPDGQMTVTNDGATTMSLMRVQHPAAKLMVQLSCAMDESAGDGTTSVVVLCAALLGVSRELIAERGLHPHQVMAGLATAAKIAAARVRAIAVPIADGDAGDPMLLQVARTALNSKMSEAAAARLGQLAAEAVSRVADRKAVRLVVVPGAAVAESTLVDGLLLPGDLLLPAKGLKSGPWGIVALQCGLTPPGSRQIGERGGADGQPVALKRYEEEERWLKKQVAALKKLGAQVVAIEHSAVEQRLNPDGVCPNPKPTVVHPRSLATVTHGNPILTLS